MVPINWYDICFYALCVVAGVVALIWIGKFVDWMGNRKRPSIRHLVYEFLYFDVTYEFEGYEYKAKVRLAANHSPYRIAWRVAKNGVHIGYCGEPKTFCLFEFSELARLSNTESLPA